MRRAAKEKIEWKNAVFKSRKKKQKIIKSARMFGFKDGKVWTLKEVGKVYHVTRERIRQI